MNYEDRKNRFSSLQAFSQGRKAKGWIMGMWEPTTPLLCSIEGAVVVTSPDVWPRLYQTKRPVAFIFGNFYSLDFNHICSLKGADVGWGLYSSAGGYPVSLREMKCEEDFPTAKNLNQIFEAILQISKLALHETEGKRRALENLAIFGKPFPTASDQPIRRVTRRDRLVTVQQTK
jgi:hypothetical protein